MVLNLPNQITFARLVLAILFLVLLSRFDVRNPNSGTLDLCLVIFLVAAATDWLDGYLARKRKEETSLGRVLDPVVDKVLICGAFIVYSGPAFVLPGTGNVTMVAPWMVVVIVARELLVTGLRGFSESKGQAFGADIFGKVKTWAQIFSATCVLVFLAHGNITDRGSTLAVINAVLLWIAVVLTSCSGLNYLYKARAVLSSAAD